MTPSSGLLHTHRQPDPARTQCDKKHNLTQLLFAIDIGTNVEEKTLKIKTVMYKQQEKNIYRPVSYFVYRSLPRSKHNAIGTIMLEYELAIHAKGEINLTRGQQASRPTP